MRNAKPFQPEKNSFPILGKIKLIHLVKAINATLIHSAVIIPYLKIPDKIHPYLPHFQPFSLYCNAVNGITTIQYSKSATAKFKTKIVVGQHFCKPNLQKLDKILQI